MFTFIRSRTQPCCATGGNLRTCDGAAYKTDRRASRRLIPMLAENRQSLEYLEPDQRSVTKAIHIRDGIQLSRWSVGTASALPHQIALLAPRDPLDLGVEPVDVRIRGRGMLALGFELGFEVPDALALLQDAVANSI